MIRGIYLTKFIFCVGAATLLTAANASVTGLCLIPIADILAHREAIFELEAEGTERNISRGYAFSNSLTLGIYDRLELGVDNDFRGSTAFSAKLQLWESPKRMPGTAMSIGFTDCDGKHCEPFVVGRVDTKTCRLHTGLWRTDCIRGVFGTDFVALGGTGSVEFLSGPGSQTWLGYSFEIKQVEGLEVSLSIGVPSNHADGVRHAISLSYGFKF